MAEAGACIPSHQLQTVWNETSKWGAGFTAAEGAADVVAPQIGHIDLEPTGISVSTTGGFAPPAPAMLIGKYLG